MKARTTVCLIRVSAPAGDHLYQMRSRDGTLVDTLRVPESESSWGAARDIAKARGFRVVAGYAWCRTLLRKYGRDGRNPFSYYFGSKH